MKTVLKVNSFGIVTGIYTEEIDLSKLGRLRVRRLTNIEFSFSRQRWEARNRSRKVLFSAPTKQECLDWEQRRFNQ